VAAPIIGSKGNEWKKMEIDLTPWAGSMVGIRFRGVTTCKEKGDFAIDDVSVEEVITTVEGVKGTTSANLSLYPNPARGEVTISVADDAGKQDYKLNILDMFGRVVYSMPVKPNDDRIHEVISLSHLVAGTYLLELRSDEKTYQKKLSIR
jgi:hypothetical protein